MECYDVIIIGGGSAGCVLAGELARHTDQKILLLESGPQAEDHPETFTVEGYKKAFLNDELMWERFSTPQAHAGKQRVFMGTGGVLGGSGAVNGMVYTRGDRRDYDAWPEGWRWSDMLPAFEAIEKKIRPNKRDATPWTEACTQAARQVGFRHSEDLNDGELSNVVGREWMNFEGEHRRNSYLAFLREPGVPDNLTIVSDACVSRIVFDRDRNASGVQYMVGDARREASASREVVLCAGALETPKLLMLSGVGPEEQLRRFDIPPVWVQPQVGQNLHDHPNVPVFIRGEAEVDAFFPQLYSFFRTLPEADLAKGQPDTCYVYWPARSAMHQVTKRMLPAMVLPESLYGSVGKSVVRGAVDLAFKSSKVQEIVRHTYAIVCVLGKPLSRGELTLKSRDPRVQAQLDPHYLEHPQDLRTLVAGVRKCRAIAGAPGMDAWRGKELMPGQKVRTDEAIGKWVQQNAITTYHFAGTCRMGEDAASVVDSRLRVRGVGRLRVADASVIPSTPVSALNAPSMVIGYRAAGWMRAGG